MTGSPQTIAGGPLSDLELDVRLAGPALAIIVPTFNERVNVAELYLRLRRCLHAISFEVIFVDDDSPDGTAQAVHALAREDRRIRCLQRVGRRGLSSACVEGMLATAAPFVAVMDADLQHDETVLPRMLELLERGDADLIVASRYADGGSVADWNPSRARMSRLATRISRFVSTVEVTDPMSGYFVLRREVLQHCVRDLSRLGFKILLDLLASHRGPLKVLEVPYSFRERQAGESKLDSFVAWEYAMLLVDKTIGRYVPARFIAFGAVGATGLVVHLTALSLLYKALAISFLASQAAATLIAMTWNYALNNELTYRDKRLRGWPWVAGWATFAFTCSIGALANVGVAGYLFGREGGWLLSALAGVLVGTVWNFTVSSFYTWKNR